MVLYIMYIKEATINFKLIEFDRFRKEAGYSTLSPQVWIENTNALASSPSQGVMVEH